MPTEQRECVVCRKPPKYKAHNGEYFCESCGPRLGMGREHRIPEQAPEVTPAPTPETAPSLSAEQQHHLDTIAYLSERVIRAKYTAGAIEHGGNLWEKPALDLGELALQEAVDLVVYLLTLQSALLQAGPGLTFSDYHDNAVSTLPYSPNRGITPVAYHALGVAEEAGEVVGKIKKALRRGANPMEDREAIMRELGDVLWYVTAVCHNLGYTLEEVARANMHKRADRQARGVIKGEGDER